VDYQKLLRATARVLGAMADPPGRRERPRPGDLEGTYDFWFDGGAAVGITARGMLYDFVDGTRAWQSGLFDECSVQIEFRDGCEVKVSLTQPPRPEDIAR
jgi:hypothetical protein